MSLVCLDIGNTQIHGGVFENNQLLFQFRYPTMPAPTSDQFGVFLKQVFAHYGIDPQSINHFSVCSVVPSLDYSVRSAIIKYFDTEPFFLQPGVKTGLKIKYRNPLEMGSDRIANAIAAIDQYPQQNLLVFDFGTATTCCVLHKNKSHLGGIIMPGLRLSMEALQRGTAKLSAVEIIKPKALVGRSVTESIQSGLYLSQLASVRALTQEIKQEYFPTQTLFTIATGGFSQLFNDLEVFDVIHPDLVLQGLRLAFRLNQ